MYIHLHTMILYIYKYCMWKDLMYKTVVKIHAFTQDFFLRRFLSSISKYTSKLKTELCYLKYKYYWK